MPVMPSARTGAPAAEPRSSPRRAPPPAPSSRSQPRMVSAAGSVMVPPRAQFAAPSTSHQTPPATRPRPMPRGRSTANTAFAFLFTHSPIYHGGTRPVCFDTRPGGQQPFARRKLPRRILFVEASTGSVSAARSPHPAPDDAPRPRALRARPGTARAEADSRQRRAAPHPPAPPPPGLPPGRSGGGYLATHLSAALRARRGYGVSSAPNSRRTAAITRAGDGNTSSSRLRA